MTAELDTTTSISGIHTVRRQFQMLIDGKLVDGAGHHEVINPATEQTIATSPVADDSQIENAIAAAKKSVRRVGRTTSRGPRHGADSNRRRGRGRADEFATIITLEQGKPLALARGDVDSAVLSHPLFRRPSART